MRGASSADVRNLILRAFQVSDYTVLESDEHGHNLFKRIDQDLDDDSVVELCGSLYLCEKFKVCAFLLLWIFHHCNCIDIMQATKEQIYILQ